MSQAVLNWIGTALLAAGALFLLLMRKGLETAVTKTTEAAIAEVNWSQVLTRELEKTRGVGRQGARLRSYGCLWSKMRPTANYGGTKIRPLDGGGAPGRL